MKWNTYRLLPTGAVVEIVDDDQEPDPCLVGLCDALNPGADPPGSDGQDITPLWFGRRARVRPCRITILTGEPAQRRRQPADQLQQCQSKLLEGVLP